MHIFPPTGAGVNVGTVIKNKPSLPPTTCPPAFEFRQLIQYKRLTDEQRQQIVTCMKEYSEYVSKRQEKLDSILPQDPRDEKEKLIAEKLELKVTLVRIYSFKRRPRLSTREQNQGQSIIARIWKWQKPLRFAEGRRLENPERPEKTLEAHCQEKINKQVYLHVMSGAGIKSTRDYIRSLPAHAILDLGQLMTVKHILILFIYLADDGSRERG